MKQTPIHLFIDFEFTMPENRNYPKNFFPEIIEAGIVVVEKDKIIDQYSNYICPKAFPMLTSRCKSFLNISQKDVQGGACFTELIAVLNSYCAHERGTVVTWGNMDMKVLKNNCKYHGIPFPLPCKHVDLSMEYKKFFGDQNQTGLWKAVQEYGKEGTGKHHRALDDALTTYNIFRLVEKDKSYLERPEPTTIGDRIDLSKIMNKYAL
ncbi:3'-5' exonuclease KapD [Sutcliffiella horikoshii]|uniref:3'-5' exonuclease KapD n=1 Tax=Sutcliffiella horikoshii TaxID=79883 RepID=UPI00203DA29C|nr:3'-5' exonuclease KapD [Sutcliffiella horikoshii]MCM3619013.1 3'-5' exonuclease KapD [Sutcliffiella horikoshii]